MRNIIFFKNKFFSMKKQITNLRWTEIYNDVTLCKKTVFNNFEPVLVKLVIPALFIKNNL